MKFLWIIGLGLLWGLSACTCDKDEQVQEEVPYVLVDTDLGGCTDDLFALSMLHQYMAEGRCRLMGVVVDRPGEENAAMADVLNTYYGHPFVPLALARGGVEETEVWTDYSAMPEWTDASGRPLYERTLREYSSLPDGWQLYRRLLAAAPDGRVRICSIGFVNVLASLLQSQGDACSPLSGVELVRRKVECLYIMAGSFGDVPQVEYNLSRCMEASRAFFDLWPPEVPICFSPTEVGEAIDYPVDEVLADLAAAERHPIRQVYQRCTIDEGQRMWDPLAVMQAVEGDSLFRLSAHGFVTMDDSARTCFMPHAQGRSRYQLPGTAAWCREMLDRIRRAIASAAS